MFLKQLVLPALLVASINAQSSIRRRPCGTPSPTEEQIEASKFLLKSERSSMRGMTQREIKVDTYFHILAASEHRSDGYVTQQQVDDQLAVINEAYAPHSISFNLINSTWTKNVRWHKGLDELDYKKALRQGDYSALNLYFLDLGIEGMCSFPMHVTQGSKDFYSDGCIVSTETMPGGFETGLNLGKTAIHEIGHWFNLFHVFEGQDCESDGDLVDDTPAQGTDSLGCQVGKDSCPKSPGLDSIHNYMDYSDDNCTVEFTPGQVNRMYSSWEKYRRNSTQ